MSALYLTLASGAVFEGEALGAPLTSPIVGELVFTTNMEGYLETLTDPSYYGQIVLQTFPLIGCYGAIPEDAESGSCPLSAYVVADPCPDPSNFRCVGTLDDFLRERGVSAISGVMTREITRLIREEGVMNAVLADHPASPGELARARDYRVGGALAATSRREKLVLPPSAHPRRRDYRIALLDCGAKRNIARELCRRGCEVTVLPYTSAKEEILAERPDGVMLSNGPGDPAENTAVIAMLRDLLGTLPIFGICLGHQLLALAAGARTVKLKYGHRGANHPVKDLRGARTYITSQNHGYAVDAESLAGTGGVLTHVNANDGTVEGIDYPNLAAFTVQFHPEAAAGPHDTAFLFDRFLDRIDAFASSTAERA